MALSISVVIPCFNEEACVEEVLVSWDAELSKRVDDYEIILVDDGSTDRTPEILARLLRELDRLRVIRKENSGHGPALLTGYREACGDWVFHADSDNQVEPRDFWKLWELRIESEYVMGVRVDRQDPWHRLIITRVLRGLMTLMLFRRVRDINVPYKLVEGQLLRDLLATIPRETFAPSILMVQAVVHWGIPIAEVEVRHFPRMTGETTLKPLKLVVVCGQALVQSLLFRVLLFGEKRPSPRKASLS